MDMSLPTISLEKSTLVQMASALIVHAIYKRYEIQPSSYILTIVLLVLPPICAASFHHQHFSSIWISLMASSAIFYGTLLLSIISYRLSPCHPLYEYPGPLAAKISKFWLFQVTSKGKLNKRVKSLHDQYGPYIRIGPNEISCIDMAAMQDIFGPSGMPKGPIWDARRHPSAPPSLVALRDLREHGQQRKAWNRALSTTAVKEYEPALVRRALQLADALEKRTCMREYPDGVVKDVDLTQWFGYFSFDFMGDMAFGGGFELMADEDKEGIWRRMEARVRYLAPLMHIPWATTLLLRFPSITESVSKFWKFTAACAIRRKEMGSSVKDLYYHLTNESGLELESPNVKSILSNGELVIIAGSDTTANALSGVFYYLLKHPSELERLREEIGLVFPKGEGDAIDTSRLAGMEVLNAVINETLRLQPPLPTYTQRAPAKGSGGHLLGQRFIPEGTAVIAPIYAIHRDPTNFSPYPNEFRPERWFSKSASSKQTEWSINTPAFMPFSMGPANCAGKNLALAEMRIVVAVLLQRFDISFAKSYDVRTYEAKLEDKFIVQVGELRVSLSTRQ